MSTTPSQSVTSTSVTTAQPGNGVAGLRIANRPAFTVLALVATDLLVLLAAGTIGILVKFAVSDAPIVRLDIYQQLWPLILLFPPVYACVGLYSGMAIYPSVALGPAEELRRASFATTSVFILLAAATFLFRDDPAGASAAGARMDDPATFSRLIFLVTWLVALVAVPLGRTMTRGLFARRSWWGHGVVVLGAGITGEMVVDALKKHPELGLKCVAMLDDDPKTHRVVHDVPVIGGLDQSQQLAREHGIQYAIVAMPGVDEHRLRELYAKYGEVYPHLLIIPSLVGFSSMWVVARDIGGIMGLEVRQRLLLTVPRIIKRSLDLLFTITGGLVILPFLLLTALLIKLDSKGPVFFKQPRPGRDGHLFEIYKFRSMHVDAEQRLARLPEDQRAEFEQFGKIRNDPRITRVGRWLRRFSIDEFPQLINVLRGEMSLVGPRAYLEKQLPQIKEHQSLIEKVAPGITGIWQISGRSKVSMDQRLEMDAYYVRNWSVWLDLYILMRTFWVVITSKGAY